MASEAEIKARLLAKSAAGELTPWVSQFLKLAEPDLLQAMAHIATQAPPGQQLSVLMLFQEISKAAREVDEATKVPD